MNRVKRNTLMGLLALLALVSLLISPALALLGDVDLNNLVNQDDLRAIAQELGLRSTDPGFNPALDLSLDGEIDVVDLAIAGRSYGAERVFHYVRQISNLTGVADVTDQDTCIDGLGRINIIWNDASHGAYFTRLDRYGNTLVDDVKLALADTSQPVGIGCDQEGNAHLVWVHEHDLYQARFDRWGYPVIQPEKTLDDYADDSSTYSSIDVDLDSQGNAFAFFRRYWLHLTALLKIDTAGRPTLATHGYANTSSLYHKIALDDQDNIHLMWYELEGSDRIYYARYGANENASLDEQIIGYTGYDGHVNGSREPDLAVDPQGNAYIVWHVYGTPNLFLESIAPDGDTVLDNYPIFNQWAGNGYTPPPVLGVDESGDVHLLGVTGWGRSPSHHAYGRFTPSGEPIQPMRWFFYGTPMYEPELVADADNDVHVTFEATSSRGYPPCADGALCYLGTAFNAAAYDLNRSDLGVDAAHLSFEPLIARWGGTVAVTATVFNEGWTTSPTSTLLVALQTEAGTRLVEARRDISPLAPHGSQNFQNLSLSLPTNPPAGLEEMEYLRLILEVDDAGTISETTEENNHLSIPILVQKLPTKTGLFLIVEDETNSVRGGVSERVITGTASISGGSYTRSDITVESDVTVLATDIPVTSDLISYTISWQAAGYAPPAPQVIGVRRNPSDPYRIYYTPGNTAVLKTNRWGSLSGTITSERTPLPEATVRLVGEGLSIETTTDSKGIFSPATEPELAQLIPGTYQIRVAKAGYARLSETLTVPPLSVQTYDRSMDTTEHAYLHGNVVNAYGNPVAGAEVEACGITTETDAQGVFDLTVHASCTDLSIKRSGYAQLTQSLSLTAGLETLLSDLTMTFDPPVSLFSAEGRVASRVIDQSTGDLLPDPPDDASWLEKELFEEFSDTFWPSYRIYIAYGAYAYNAAVAYSGPSGDRHLQFVQVSFNPQTFEVHAFLPTIEFKGVPVTIPIVSDSGIRSAILVIEARLVNVSTGEVLATQRTPIEGAAGEWIFDQAILTYDFRGRAIPDWENCEVWLYYKVGRNNDGQFTSPPQLYQHDRQIMKFDLSSGKIWLDYGLGEFPLP